MPYKNVNIRVLKLHKNSTKLKIDLVLTLKLIALYMISKWLEKSLNYYTKIVKFMTFIKIV